MGDQTHRAETQLTRKETPPWHSRPHRSAPRQAISGNDWKRSHASRFIQALLEEEITELLGRPKAVRRAAVDAPHGLRNGYGKPRRLSLRMGTSSVRRPRVRGLGERFVSRVLPLFQRRTREVGELLPQLYLHGVALGDFELALRGLLGAAEGQLATGVRDLETATAG
ncbi:MAG TPA: transposase [Candidatus Tectomicrobia bacterium]|nr:transposase [Candidatus Tectomicrobia bacterium]